jgi:hypothetical protein
MDQEEITDKLKILGLIILAISLILIFKYETREEYYQKELANEQFGGIIVDKFRDSTSHGAHVIVLMQGDKFEKITTDWWGDLYKLCNKNDIVFKKLGNRYLELIRANDMDTIKIEYDRIGPNTGKLILRSTKH